MSSDRIELKAGDWQVEICPRLGGNITRLSHKEQDVLRPLESEEQLERSPYTYGAPILMPANRTKGACFLFDGRTYALPLNEPQNGCNLHGSLLHAAFTLVDRNEASAVLRLLDKDGRYYPFPFLLTLTYVLKKEGLTATYDIENIGQGDMPLTFALHTTFIEPSSFSVPIDLCLEKDLHHIPTGRYVPLNEAEKAYATGSPSKGRTISGYYHACGQTVYVGNYVYTVSGGFDHWILFNGRGNSGYLCIEPQMGKVNGLNMKDGHRRLESGAHILLTTHIFQDI